jgi:SagB-type dehydrogenase family enzyme
VEVAPPLWVALHACTDWRTADELCAALGVGAIRVRDFVRVLTSQTLLQRSDAEEDPAERAMSAIAEWNPAAGFFHAATRRVDFLAPPEAARLMRARGRQRPMPPAVKRVRGATRVPLPPPDVGGEFPQVLLSRRTWRRFGAGQVAATDVATTLGLVLGVQQWVSSEFGALALKTSPSGGARHPIEGYVCVRNVAGIPAGLYHYAADAHCLERMKGAIPASRLREWMPHSDYFTKAGFIVVLTAVLDRQVWRYPYARAYRAALAEAGHVCQTFCLTATWLGLAPFCLMGLDDRAIEADLGIDGVQETVLYVAGAGRRPRGSTWAPRPRGTLRAKPNPAFRPG